MKIRVALPSTGIEEYRALKKIIYSGKFVSGKNVSKFEEKFAKHNNVKYACAVNSGTAALHLINLSLNLKEGDEIIVPPLTFISSITPLLYNNITPVFADIDKDTFCIDPEDVERKITKKTKGILAVHFAGNSCEMSKLTKISKKYSLFLIEDCAQSHDTEFKGKKVGSFGIASAFSFYSTKHITTGEGGIILSNNKKIIEKCKMLRNHGLVGRNNHKFLGFNYRMSELNAAIGLAQIKKINKIINSKIKISKKILLNIDQLNNHVFTSAKLEKNIKHTFFWCPILLNSKSGYNIKYIIDLFKKNNIELRYRYFEPLYKQEVFLNYFKNNKKNQYKKFKNLKLRNAENICGNLIGLPNHHLITNKEINKILNLIKTLK